MIEFGCKYTYMMGKTIKSHGELGYFNLGGLTFQ